MTDSFIASDSRRPYHLPMEDRVARLEVDMQDVKSVLSRLEPMIVRIDATLTATLPSLATKAELTDMRSDLAKDISGLRIEISQEISDLRTGVSKDVSDLRTDGTGVRAEMIKEISGFRAEMIAKFADVPTKTYLWGILGVLITAYGSGLAALAVLR
jgi:hypothetical protein